MVDSQHRIFFAAHANRHLRDSQVDGHHAGFGRPQSDDTHMIDHEDPFSIADLRADLFRGHSLKFWRWNEARASALGQVFVDAISLSRKGD